MPQAAATTVDTAAILREGAYYVLDDYAMREEMYAKVGNAVKDGNVTIVAGGILGYGSSGQFLTLPVADWSIE